MSGRRGAVDTVLLSRVLDNQLEAAATAGLFSLSLFQSRAAVIVLAEWVTSPRTMRGGRGRRGEKRREECVCCGCVHSCVRVRVRVSVRGHLRGRLRRQWSVLRGCHHAAAMPTGHTHKITSRLHLCGGMSMRRHAHTQTQKQEDTQSKEQTQASAQSFATCTSLSQTHTLT